VLSYKRVGHRRYADATVFKRIFSAGPAGPIFYSSLVAALIGFGLFFDHVDAVGPARSVLAALQTDLARAGASPEVTRVARWAIDSEDHFGLPFIIVDKANARLFSFDPTGRLSASAPVLLGASRGDGPRAPAATPAGRFVAATWLSMGGDGIVWINADAALSLFGIPSGISPGRGMQRLASNDLQDKRISDGSLHVAGQFYRDHLDPLKNQASIVYVLPEVVSAADVFSMVPADSRFAQSPRAQTTSRKPS
jgi:hypothetical protein